MGKLIFIIFLCFSFFYTYGFLSLVTHSYIAAVVEYAPTGNTTVEDPQTVILQNVELYKPFIENASNQGADIIVFPECGLSTMNIPTERALIRPYLTELPNPSLQQSPCMNFDSSTPQVLQELSCAARENNIYVVVNLPELAPCSGSSCPADGAFFYNTNIVFNRNGSIIARYRKYNLFDEPGFNITSSPELSTFDTDFGVRFGMIICNDLLYYSPAVQLLEDGITDIVYSTAWFSELPFLTAVEFQAAWAYKFDVNFLASGLNRVDFFNAGSGIYAGQNGMISGAMPFKTTSKMFISRVQKKSHSCTVKETMHDVTYTTHETTNVMENTPVTFPDTYPIQYLDGVIPYSVREDLTLFRDYLQVYENIVLENHDSGYLDYNKTLCYHEFCCNFHISGILTVSPYDYKYRAVVFEGVRQFAGNKTAGIRVCAVVTCTNSNITSCGLYSNGMSSNTVFTSLNITGSFSRNNSFIVMPTMLNNLLPLSVNSYSYQEEIVSSSQVRVSLSISSPVSQLFTFGIYERNFLRDGETATLI